MIFVKADALKRGMRLAKPIYNREGVMLYERDSKLTEQGIVSIVNFGLIGVYILEAAEPLPPMNEDDIEFERFQAMAVFSIKDILEAVSNQKEAKGLYQLANKIIKAYGMLDRRINFIQNLRSSQDYVYKHSLNTAILCAMMTHRMNMGFKEQLDIVIAAILHDVGSLLIPPALSHLKKDDLTPENIKKINTYHYAIYQMVNNDFDMDENVRKVLKQAIRKIHGINMGNSDENNNLSGLPTAANRVAVDVEVIRTAYFYDNMTAMNFEEEPLSDIAAIRYLLNEDNGFDQVIVTALIGSINLLQPGLCVELTNGDKGLVVAANNKNVLEPQILSFRDNVIYNMADSFISKDIQIKDIMKTMDNRYVMDFSLLEKYSGKTLHIGDKLEKKTY